MPGIFQCCFVVYRLIRINNNDNSLISPCRQITGYQHTTVDWSCLEWWNKLIGTQYGLQQTISLYQFSAALVQAVVFKQSQKQIFATSFNSHCDQNKMCDVQCAAQHWQHLCALQ